jgi:hypothetical protein
VFSDLNNLIDLSLDHRYTSICGISEKEMHDYFDGGIATLAEANNLTKDECYERLRQDFDGYYFSPLSKEGMYNPFSVLNTLSSQVFYSYWFETGMTNYIYSQIQAQNYSLDMVANEPLCDFQLHILENGHDRIVQQLYQSGYLTIKGYDKEFKTYTLSFPNHGVKEGLENGYSNYIANKTVRQGL